MNEGLILATHRCNTVQVALKPFHPSWSLLRLRPKRVPQKAKEMMDLLGEFVLICEVCCR